MSSREHGHCLLLPGENDTLHRAEAWHGRIEAAGTTGIRISPVVMGMWQAGKEMWAGSTTRNRRAVRAAFDAGINAFDTAEMYGKGTPSACWRRPPPTSAPKWST